MKPLTVELLVCPTCKQVGRLPLHKGGQLKGFCTGGIKAKHRKARMESRLFVEAEPERVAA